MEESNPTLLLKLPQVIERTALSRSEIYRRLRDGRFPKPVPLGDRGIAWLSTEIEAWVHARVAERDRRATATA